MYKNLSQNTQNLGKIQSNRLYRLPSIFNLLDIYHSINFVVILKLGLNFKTTIDSVTVEGFNCCYTVLHVGQALKSYSMCICWLYKLMYYVCEVYVNCC